MAKIFLDPGHGGTDPGAVANGMRESDIALEVSRRTRDILQRAGHEIFMSRTTDAPVSINTRWLEANRWHADYFISVHANAGGGTGVETLVPVASPNNRDRDLQACRELAASISNAIGREFGIPVRRANGVMLESETRHGSIGVLRHTAMTAVLVELAFIDSPEQNRDVTILRNQRQRLAETLARAILEFMGDDGMNTNVNFTINGKKTDIAGHIVNKRSFFPAAQLERFGFEVRWDEAASTVDIIPPTGGISDMRGAMIEIRNTAERALG